MTVRAGMSALIRKLRHLGQAGMEDYQVVDEIYWSDQHVQDILDGHKQRVIWMPLKAEPEYIDSEDEYKRYVMNVSTQRFGAEGTAGGTAIFRIANSEGETVTGYTFAPHDLSVTFAADTDGSAYYFSGYLYDMNSAAKELWTMKAGHAWSAVNFSADGHRFDRGQLHDHCLTMAKVYEAADGVRVVKMRRTDIHGPGEGGHF